MVVVPVKVLVPERVTVPVPVLIRLKLFSFVPDPPRMPPKLMLAVVLSVRLTEVALPLTTRLAVPAPTFVSPAKDWAKPFNFRTPLEFVVPSPRVRAVPVGRALAMPRRRAPFLIEVPPP